MAGDYKMLFQLGAQLGGDFQSAFSNASKTIQQAQAQIRALNQEHGNITAYEKQMDAVSKTSAKLEALKADYDDIQREIQETEGFSSSLSIKEREKQRQIEQTSEKLNQQTEKLNTMGQALQDAGVDTEHLDEESEKLRAEMDRLGDEMQNAKNGADEFGDAGSKSFSAVGAAAVAAGVLEGIKKIAEAYREAVEEAQKYADEVLTVSTQYGIAADDLQAYYYAAELVDVSVETMTQSMAKNVKSMGSAQDGAKKQTEAYEELGVSIENADGTLRDAEDVYWEVIDALGKMDNETQKDVIAQDLLGRSAMQLNPLIEAGSEAMQAYAQKAQETGNILSDDVLSALGALDDASQVQERNILALKSSLASVFAPEITNARNLINDVLSDVTIFVQKHPAVVKGITAATAALATFSAGYLVYNAAKKAGNILSAAKTALNITEKASQDALNASILVNPYVAVAASVAALTGLLVAFIAKQKEATEETAGLTLASKEEYAALQEKQASYEQAAELYGENSEQARNLAAEVDYLNDKYQANKQTLEEWISAEDEALTQIANDLETKEKAMTAAQQQGDKNLYLVGRLRELAAQTETTVESQSEMLSIIELLNQSVPDLALNYDDVTNGIANLDDVDALVQAAAKQAALNAAIEEAAAAYSAKMAAEAKSTKYTELLEDATTAAADAENNYNQAVRDVKNERTGIDAFLSLFNGGLRESKNAMDDARDSVDAYQTKLDEANAEIAEANDAYSEATMVLQEYGAVTDATASTSEQFNSIITNSKEEIQQLADEYAATYNAAYDSISGQYDLWDYVEETVATDVGSIIENLQSQNEHWENYNANLEKLQAQTGNVEGLSEVIASFADGSEESVSAIAGMAEATPAELQKMVTEWKKVQTSHETTSTSLAKLVENTDQKLADIVSRTTNAVGELDQSDLALSSGYNTVLGFINGAESLRASVIATFTSLAEDAVNAYNEKAKIESPSKVMMESGRYMVEGLVLGVQQKQEAVRDVMTATGQVATDSIMPALSFPSGDRGGSSVSVTFNIEGNATPQTVEQLDAYGDDFAQRVMRIVEEAQEDSSRRVYR